MVIFRFIFTLFYIFYDKKDLIVHSECYRIEENALYCHNTVYNETVLLFYTCMFTHDHDVWN